MAILTNQRPTIYRNLYENTGPGLYTQRQPSKRNALTQHRLYVESPSAMLAQHLGTIGSACRVCWEGSQDVLSTAPAFQ